MTIRVRFLDNLFSIFPRHHFSPDNECQGQFQLLPRQKDPRSQLKGLKRLNILWFFGERLRFISSPYVSSFVVGSTYLFLLE